MVTSRELTVTRSDVFLPNVWAEDTQNAIEHEEVLTKLVSTKHEAVMSIGKTLTIPQRSNLATQDKTQGLSTPINFQAVTETDQTVTVTTFQYAAQLLNAVVAVQSKYDERARITHSMGYALMRGMEISISTLFVSFSQIVGTYGADPDDSVLRRAWQYLADQSVDQGAAWVFGPAATAALFGNDKFTSRDFIDGKSAIETAKLTDLYSYPVFHSNLLNNPATGQTACTLLHPDQVILIRQIQPSVREQFQINNLADGLVAYDLYSATEAEITPETPATDSPASSSGSDILGILIRTA